MRAALEVGAVPGAARAGDVFVLHPKDRPDVCLALTGRDLLSVKTVLDGFARASERGELSEVVETVAARLGGYFAGLK
jgi:hypothetical protein